MSDRDAIEIRSFRVVFDLDRRLHRIDRWRLPLPYGLPLRSLGYAAATLAAVLLATRLPIVGPVLTALPAPVRLAILPAAASYALTSIRIDGRPAHDAFLAVLLWRLRPRVVSCWRHGVAPGTTIRLGDATIAPGATGPALRRGTVRGPAVARVRYPATVRERGRALQLHQASDEPLDGGFQVEFGRGRRLVIR